jgi:hypothetical protein
MKWRKKRHRPRKNKKKTTLLLESKLETPLLDQLSEDFALALALAEEESEEEELDPETQLVRHLQEESDAQLALEIYAREADPILMKEMAHAMGPNSYARRVGTRSSSELVQATTSTYEKEKRVYYTKEKF